MAAGTASVVPILRYRDAGAAIDFLERAFGFRRGMVATAPDGTVQHAELVHGDGMIMLGTAHEGEASPWGRPGGGVVYVAVQDADAHHARAREAGAEIIIELTDQPYGSREYGARDPEGNLWSFGTYRPALASAEPADAPAAG